MAVDARRPAPDCDVGEIERALRLLIEPEQTFEIRALGSDRGRDVTWSGYFVDPAAAAAAIPPIARSAIGVYVTLNPVRPELRARRPDRIGVAKKGETTGDQHIVRRTRLLFDIDAERPAGISSSDVEHKAAIDVAQELSFELSELGWPEPLVADSGNGGHLVYGIDLPTDDGGLVSRVLAKAAERWSCKVGEVALKVDTTVANPSRISKLYGTLTRKGDNFEDRVHRPARILSAPERLEPIPRELLEAYAGASAAPTKTKTADRPPTSPSRDLPSLDAATWLGRHGLEIKSTSPNKDGGTVYELAVCPFNGDHDRGEAFVIQRGSGAIIAGCHHESCKWDWRELRERYEPRATRERAAAPDRHPNAPPDQGGLPHGLTIVDGGRGKDHDPKPRPKPRILTNSEAYEELLKLEGMPVYETPLPSLNAALGYGGIIAGGVYDIVAGPGVGKSTLAVFVAGAIADKWCSLYATWEMQPGRLLARLAGGRLNRQSNNLSRTSSREEILGVAPNGMRWISKPSLDELEEAILIVADEFGRPPIVVTDYVQRMAEAIMRTQAKPDARLATAEASERLTIIGERTGAPFLAVAAASRAGRSKAAEARTLAPGDLIDVARESSGLEFDSSGLLVLSDTGETDEDGWKVRTLTVAKARYGEECHIDLRFEGATGAYRDAGRIAEAARKAKKEAKDELMREEIIESLKAAGTPLSKRAIRERKDDKGKLVRWVKGREPDVRVCIDAMAAAGDLRAIGSLFALPEDHS